MLYERKSALVRAREPIRSWKLFECPLNSRSRVCWKWQVDERMNHYEREIKRLKHIIIKSNYAFKKSKEQANE